MFKIVKERDDRQRIHGDQDNLIGLITKETNGVHRVEMLMKIDETVLPGTPAHVAFVRGAEAALRAYKIMPRLEKSGERERGQ